MESELVHFPWGLSVVEDQRDVGGQLVQQKFVALDLEDVVAHRSPSKECQVVFDNEYTGYKCRFVTLEHHPLLEDGERGSDLVGPCSHQRVEDNRDVEVGLVEVSRQEHVLPAGVVGGSRQPVESSLPIVGVERLDEG